MRELLGRFVNDEGGAAASEYCLIAAATGLAVFGAVKLVGPYLKNIFTSAAPSLADPATELIRKSN